MLAARAEAPAARAVGLGIAAAAAYAVLQVGNDDVNGWYRRV
jgi:hypothetical protein